ncbi:MAG: hypothetical protein A3K09_05070 [Nitrospinae bacterium RIFCSPLOWO2_12_FULL_47_7]|nr:MAG: hypothetical protein A3K09_05070 [Nitrospinae bacterium RIFCSPLOWO2_12_FULL_47_7]
MRQNTSKTLKKHQKCHSEEPEATKNLASSLFSKDEILCLAQDDAAKRLFPHPAGPLLKTEGFTIIEIILALVIIGIVVVSMMNMFSGLKDIKKPEYAVQASFLALKQMEGISKQYYDAIPVAGTYTCAAFSATLTTVDCTSATYTFAWLVENSTLAAPNVVVGAADMVKKVTLTVTRADNGMNPIQFYTLFSPLSTE